jgi:hypothetical protein
MDMDTGAGADADIHERNAFGYFALIWNLHYSLFTIHF